MARVEASAEFAKEVAALKSSFRCGLKPDVNNVRCFDIRVPAGLSSIKRGADEHAQYAVEGVPVVCLHCVGARQGKWSVDDILVRKEDPQ